MRTTNPTPAVSGRYGAPLGRVSDALNSLCGSIGEDWSTFTLRRIRINSGGYDNGGAYWGLGAPLYWACAESRVENPEEWSGIFRARSRADAKAQIRDACPAARFFR